MINRLALVVAITASMLLSACAAMVQFDPYEGENVPRLGQGGAKTVVDGMDVWTRGEPPRRYRIAGYLQVLQYPGTQALAVDRARQAGGAALIQGETVHMAEGGFRVNFTIIQFVD